MKYSLLAASIGLCFSGQLFAVTYDLTELPTNEKTKHTYVMDANESGTIVGRSTELFNLPIDVSYLDIEDSGIKSAYDSWKRNLELRDETIDFTLEQIKNENAAATNADANLFMRNFLSSRAGNAEFQKLNSGIASVFTATTAEEKVLFDANRGYTNNELSRSTIQLLTAVASDGTAVGWGTAPYDQIQFRKKDENEDTTFFQRAHTSRAILVKPSGEVMELPAKFTDDYGSYSIATDIKKLNDGSYLVVGQSAVSVEKDSQDRFNDNCKNEDEPTAVCAWELQNAGYYDLRAYQWKLDANFNIIEADTDELGIGLTRNDDEERIHISSALAVNNAGIAVGNSNTREGDDFIVRQRAGYYQGGAFKPVVDHDKGYESSRAVAINDNNVVVGYRMDEFSTGNNSNVKGYYYEIDNSKYVEIESFYEGSDMYVRDINNAGQIIGQAEVEKNVASPRREAFLFDKATGKLNNINDLLPCKSAEFPYDVSEAIKITENGNIYAIATKTVNRKDALGNNMKDSNGNDEFESVAIPVLLTRNNSGEPAQCAPDEAETYERGSASFGILSLLAAPLVMLRRRRKAK
ncbi:DUF3466 family protein [Pseudoalteromonas luteoviolacea]|uniref:DUF3466 family protein n=1 Tax=Pseudoalteromonas luteoviolacea S4060-1 TaxID=1365257 RepID=A0A167KKH4_9GAMM|nr:DUF3466 family protein [Pseudoalteromonas luteoviolacea]KZN62922.1 hypothetical protein N478_24620 [Pseudoalteromonas luteoviolacea S4060-1]